jgi:hypothetical protein
LFNHRMWNGAVLVLASVAILLTGCGSEHNVGTVSGKVTLDNQPLVGATVQFQPSGGSPSSGITDSSGNYTLRYTRDTEGAEIGEHTVRITTYSGPDPDADPPRKAVPEKVPSKYNAKSELKATVKSGSNTFDFPLESAATGK